MMAEPILGSGAYRPISEYELGDTADFHSGDIETHPNNRLPTLGR